MQADVILKEPPSWVPPLSLSGGGARVASYAHGIFTYAFLRLSNTYFNQRNGYENTSDHMENTYFYVFLNLKIYVYFLSFRVSSCRCIFNIV